MKKQRKRLKLEELTAEQKIGMVMCIRSLPNNPEHEDNKFVLDMIRKRAIGCVQLAAHKPDILKKVVETADYPILIFNDTEMGFPTSTLPKVPMIALSACDNPEYYESYAKSVVTEAKKRGYNGTWSPVIDVLHCDGPCMVYRQISDDPWRVARGAEAIARVFKRNGYLAGGKHYPGGGFEPFDGHMMSTVSPYTEKELRECDLIPYKHLLEKGLLPTIMTHHREYEKIDPGVAGTLSPKVQSIIRDMGFDGVTFTDSIAMMSILQKYGEENVMGLAIAAGCDVVLPNYRTSPQQSYEYLMKNYRDGMFSEERLNEAVRRVLAAQDFVASEPESEDEFTPHDLENLNAIARDCITAVCEDGFGSALEKGEKKRLFIVSVRNGEKEDCPDGPEIVVETWYKPFEIAAKIRREFPDAKVVFLPEFSNHRENDAVLVEASKAEEVVFVSFCETEAYLGTDGLTRRTEAVINALAASGKLQAVVHFGNPFALKYLMPVPRMIFGYNMEASQGYAIDVLRGNIPARGKLPFKIKFHQWQPT